MKARKAFKHGKKSYQSLLAGHTSADISSESFPMMFNSSLVVNLVVGLGLREVRTRDKLGLGLRLIASVVAFEVVREHTFQIHHKNWNSVRSFPLLTDMK